MYFKMTCMFLLFFPLFSMFITLTVSSPWECLNLKFIPEPFEISKFTSRLKSEAVFFHLSGTFLIDPPILEVKTFDLPLNQLLIHQFSIARIKGMIPFIFNEQGSACSWGM